VARQHTLSRLQFAELADELLTLSVDARERLGGLSEGVRLTFLAGLVFQRIAP
jgi:hypothetical protein